jgi:hypothetical protein
MVDLDEFNGDLPALRAFASPAAAVPAVPWFAVATLVLLLLLAGGWSARVAVRSLDAPLQ